MKIAILGGQEWETAATAEGFDAVGLQGAPPATPGEDAQARIAGLADAGGRLMAGLERTAPNVLLDMRASGLSFVQGARGIEELKLTHEAAGIPLVSYFDGSVAKTMNGLPWSTAWQVLQSKTWTKGVTDSRHAKELRAFGVPEVRDVLAAVAGVKDCVGPTKPEDATLAVSFVGDAGLSEVLTVSAGSQMENWIGMAAAAVGGYAEAPCFFDIYHALYSCGAVPGMSDAHEMLAEKAAIYFRAKQRYLAELSFRARDRFVVFLSRKIPAEVAVSGDGWRDSYGVDAEGPILDQADRVSRYRSAAINIGLPDPNSELSFDPRCLEIAAAGGFLLCFHTHDIESYFDVGRECATFRDEQELLEQISAHLADPQKRTLIARAGQQRVQRDHLIRHRLHALVDGVAHSPSLTPTNDRAAPLSTGKPPGGEREIEGGGTVAKIAADIDAALQALGRDVIPTPDTTERSIRVVDGPDRLMVLLNPGKFTRYYLEDMANAAEALGIETIRFEMRQTWERAHAGQAPNTQEMAELIRARHVKAVIGSGLNGVLEWGCGAGANGRPIPLFEQLGATHLLWWTDHPQWASEKQALQPEIQGALRSPNCHHFVKSELAARELQDMLHWPNCHGLPVAENPDRLIPATRSDAAYDVVAIVGSPPALNPAFEPLLTQDRPDPAQLNDIAARLAGEKLQAVWDRHAPSDMRVALEALASRWVDARRLEPLVGSYWQLKRLTPEHETACTWLAEHHLAYFDAIEALWQFGRWQRTFFLRYLSRFFKVAVFGSDWSSVGIEGGGWIEHVDQPAAYARGRVAINVSQAGEEEGISHKPFQIAASGVPMVHIHRKGLTDCFAPDAEVVRFDSPAQARDQIGHLLANRRQGELMAEAARARLCREHTWMQRVPQMLRTAGVTFAPIAEARQPGEVQEMAAEIVAGTARVDHAEVVR